MALAPSHPASGRGKIIKLKDLGEAGLTYDTLEKLLLRAWGAQGPQWKRLFSAMGFDDLLRAGDKSLLPLSLSLHSTTPAVQLRRGVQAPVPYDYVVGSVVQSKGKLFSLGTAAVYQLATASGAIFGGVNYGHSPCEITGSGIMLLASPPASLAPPVSHAHLLHLFSSALALFSRSFSSSHAALCSHSRLHRLV